MVDWYVNKDVVLDGGYSIVASPWFGFAGLAGTSIILYVTRMFSRNAIAECYETADGQRLGFRMHNMLGNPGRRFEVPIGNARFSNMRVSSFTKSMVGVKIDGIKYNCVMDRDGDFVEPDRLRALLLADKQVNITDSKEHRIAWKKAAARAKKRE